MSIRCIAVVNYQSANFMIKTKQQESHMSDIQSICVRKQEATWLMAQLKEYVSAVRWWYDDLITHHGVLSVSVVKKLNVLSSILEKYQKMLHLHTFRLNTHVN